MLDVRDIVALLCHITLNPFSCFLCPVVHPLTVSPPFSSLSDLCTTIYNILMISCCRHSLLFFSHELWGYAMNNSICLLSYLCADNKEQTTGQPLGELSLKYMIKFNYSLIFWLSRRNLQYLIWLIEGHWSRFLFWVKEIMEEPPWKRYRFCFWFQWVSHKQHASKKGTRACSIEEEVIIAVLWWGRK